MLGEERLHTVSVSAPGKVILHGEHSVVYGKTAIATSLGLRSCIVIKEVSSSQEESVEVRLPCVGLQQRLALDALRGALHPPPLLPSVSGRFSWRLPALLDHERHLRHVECFLQRLMPAFDDLQNDQKNSLRSFLYVFFGIFGSTNLTVKPMEISIGSELTIGAGTGSSATFVVCLAGALIQLLKLKAAGAGAAAAAPSDESTAAEHPTAGGQFSQLEKEIISAWAYNCEKIMHGAPSGIDNATCTFGALVEFRAGSRPRPLDVRLGLRILLVDSRVTRETRAQVTHVAGVRRRHPRAVHHVLQACDHVARAATEVLRRLSADRDTVDVDTEYELLSELWDMNHCLLAALGVSHPALEEIRALAGAHGLACKLTGAGGGGYALVLVGPRTPRAVVDALSGQLMQRGYRPRETTLGGPGVRLEC